MRYVSCIRKGDAAISPVDFESLSEGDVFFVNGQPYVVGVDAHYSGDASYDGWLLYDAQGESWFPEELDTDAETVLRRNLKEGDLVWIEGDAAELWIKDYDIRVTTLGTVVATPGPHDKKVLVSIEFIDGDDKADVMIRRSRLHPVLDPTRKGAAS